MLSVHHLHIPRAPLTFPDQGILLKTNHYNKCTTVSNLFRDMVSCIRGRITKHRDTDRVLHCSRARWNQVAHLQLRACLVNESPSSQTRPRRSCTADCFVDYFPSNWFDMVCLEKNYSSHFERKENTTPEWTKPGQPYLFSFYPDLLHVMLWYVVC